MKRNAVFQVQITPDDNTPASSGKKTFGYNSNLYKFSRSKAETYAERVGADYILLDKPWDRLKDYHPCYHKLFVYELLKDYDNILYVDSDSIVTRYCPDVFDLGISFGATLDYADLQYQGHRYSRFGLSKNWPYFCSGVLLFTKEFYDKTKNVWERELHDHEQLPVSTQHDQSLFNILVSKYLGKYSIFDNNFGQWSIKGKFIIHYNGITKTINWSSEDHMRWEDNVKVPSGHSMRDEYWKEYSPIKSIEDFYAN